MKTIPDKSIDLILTDPPYGINFLSNRTDHHDRLVNDDFDSWLKSLPLWFFQFRRILTDTGCCCCCAGGGKTPVVALFTVEFIKFFELIQTVVWYKKTIGLGWRYRPAYETIIIGSKSKDGYNWYTSRGDVSNVVSMGNIIPQEDDHPTVKPAELMEFFIGLHSKPGDIVLDPFLGSGTTLLACRKTGRIGLGFEIEHGYEELIRKRALCDIKPLEGYF